MLPKAYAVEINFILYYPPCMDTAFSKCRLHLSRHVRAKTSAWQPTQRYCYDDFLLTNNFKKKSFCIGTYAHKTKK